MKVYSLTIASLAVQYDVWCDEMIVKSNEMVKMLNIQVKLLEIVEIFAYVLRTALVPTKRMSHMTIFHWSLSIWTNLDQSGIEWVNDVTWGSLGKDWAKLMKITQFGLSTHAHACNHRVLSTAKNFEMQSKML